EPVGDNPSDWNGIVNLWDVASGKVRRTLRGYTGGFPSLALALSGDGQTLALGGQDGLVQLWDAVTGERLRTFRGQDGQDSFVSPVAFSVDGKALAVGGGGFDPAGVALPGQVTLWVVAPGSRADQ